MVFCERALPGQRVRARATNVRSRHALAVKLATLRPSPDEVSHLRAGRPAFLLRLYWLLVCNLAALIGQPCAHGQTSNARCLCRTQSSPV